MITQDQIVQLANKFQIDQYSIVREYLQLLFLKYFYELKDSQNIFFKGGTAIHFLYGSFRFSEDLDFTSLRSADVINKLLDNTIQKLKVEIPEIRLADLEVKENSLTELIKYTYGLKQPLTIRLEFSFREKPLTKSINPIETPFPIIPYPLVVHMDLEELLAEKIRALFTRKKGRDVFDLWYILTKDVRIKEEHVRKKLLWYKLNYSFSNLVDIIKSFSEKRLENDLGKFLPKNYRPFIKSLKLKTLEKLGVN